MGLFSRRPKKSEAERSLEELQAGGLPTSVAPSTGFSPMPDQGTVSADPGSSSFRMAVEDVFFITGRGTVVTGVVELGSVNVGQQVTLTSTTGAARRVEVSGIEAFRKLLDTAAAGQNVGLLLTSVKRDDVARGDVLSA